MRSGPERHTRVKIDDQIILLRLELAPGGPDDEALAKLLNKYKDKLEEMAETLLDKEVLSHADLREMLGDRPYGKHPEGIYGGDGESVKSNGSGTSVDETQEELKFEESVEATDGKGSSPLSEPGKKEKNRSDKTASEE
jgi:hypothetical protein